MERKTIAAALAAGCFIVLMALSSTGVVNTPGGATLRAVPGEKVDSGLGNLPHWVDATGLNQSGGRIESAAAPLPR